MKSLTTLIMMSVLAPTVIASQGGTRAEAIARKYPPLPDTVERHSVTIWSDGTKMAGDVYRPAELEKNAKLPVIIFIAGTHETKKGTPARMAPAFVENGYIFPAFDYLSWAESDSRLQMLEPMPEPDKNGNITVKARAIPWQMNFADQVQDIQNAIAFAAGAGGKMSGYAHIRYNTARSIGYSAIEATEKITIPMLITDAEKEELTAPQKNGKRLAEILKHNGTPIRYHVRERNYTLQHLPKKFIEATAMEVEWFDRYLHASPVTTT